MARTNYPKWVLELDDSQLCRHFDPETIDRGYEYAKQSRVGAIAVAASIVTAHVRGSRYRAYHISVMAPAGPESLVATCSCPMQYECKHAAALILHMRNVGHRAGTPAWEQALNPLLQRTVPGRGGVRLALQFHESAGGFWMRPLKMGARDRWIKSGATWVTAPSRSSIPPNAPR